MNITKTGDYIGVFEGKELLIETAVNTGQNSRNSQPPEAYLELYRCSSVEPYWRTKLYTLVGSMIDEVGRGSSIMTYHMSW
jgi:hypothetical protein